MPLAVGLLGRTVLPPILGTIMAPRRLVATALLLGSAQAFCASLQRSFSTTRLFSDNGNPGQLENPRALPINGTTMAYEKINGDPSAPPLAGDNPVDEKKRRKMASIDVSSILAIDPTDIEVVTVEPPLQPEEPPSPDIIKRLPFVSMFRGSANYIANHRNTLAVYHIPGGLLDLPDPTVFRDLMNDVALTWLLGMKVILVVGCRHQIEKRVKDEERYHGLRVTDEDTLRIVKEEAGYVRFEVERQLARSLRVQGGNNGGGGGGAGATGHGYYDGNVVSGNFYSAQPFGILDGVDYRESLLWNVSCLCDLLLIRSPLYPQATLALSAASKSKRSSKS